jgi:hypothetical protein
MKSVAPNEFHPIADLTGLKADPKSNVLTTIINGVVLVSKALGVVTGFIQLFNHKHNGFKSGDYILSSHDNQVLDDVTHFMIPKFIPPAKSAKEPKPAKVVESPKV